MSTSCGWEGKGRYRLIPIADERVGVQVKLRDPLRTRTVPEHFCGGVSLRRGAISSVRTFIFTFKWSPEQLGQDRESLLTMLCHQLVHGQRFWSDDLADTNGSIRAPAALKPRLTG